MTQRNSVTSWFLGLWVQNMITGRLTYERDIRIEYL